MTPEQREQMLRMRARGGDAAPGRGAPPARFGETEGGAISVPNKGESQPESTLAKRNPAATTIDALFGPLPVQETSGRVWVHTDKQLRPLRLRLGISDGQATELLEGELEPGMEVVTNVTTGNETRPAIQGGFPGFMGPPGRGFGPPGGGGGNRGGGNRGGGGRGGD
jgi:hypothetical protein